MQLSPSCAIWLKKHKIPIESWNLPTDEVSRFASDRIGISSMYSPASAIGQSELGALRTVDHLVILDMSYLNSSFITPSEQIGIILHEIGHIFNPSIQDPSTYMNQSWHEELYADYYVFHCGYATYFRDALTKLKKARAFGFESDNIDLRIKELSSPSLVRLNLSP